MAASETGMSRLAGVSEAFHGLGRSAESVTRRAGDVQAGSLDQVRRVEGIADRIALMQEVMQRATSSALERAQAGEELRSQAQDLRVILSFRDWQGLYRRRSESKGVGRFSGRGCLTVLGR